MNALTSPINTLRALSMVVWLGIICAIFLPTYREASLRADFILCGMMVVQVFQHSRLIMEEMPSNSEESRLDLSEKIPRQPK